MRRSFEPSNVDRRGLEERSIVDAAGNGKSLSNSLSYFIA